MNDFFQDSTISAKPELRDLARESVRFVPTNLRVKRDDGVKKPIIRTNALGLSTTTAKQAAVKTTDEAYADFMNELNGLL